MSKFTTVDLSDLLNLTLEGIAPPWDPELAALLVKMPAGQQTFLGIPFTLEPPGGPRWLELRGNVAAEVPAQGQASFVVFAHFCNVSIDPETRRQFPDLKPGEVLKVGEHLADYVFVYRDGTEHRLPIRRRFEINEPQATFNHLAFSALPHQKDRPVDFRGPHNRDGWGRAQKAQLTSYFAEPIRYWVYALRNPQPEKELACLRLEPTGADCLAVAGITLYHGEHHPLQYRRLEAFRVTLSGVEVALPEQVEANVDLGILARKYAVPAFDHERWLIEDFQGWGEEARPPQPTRDLRLEIAASPDATLMVNGHALDLGPVYATGKGTSNDGAVHVEFLPADKTWVHVSVEDAATGKVTPVRVHFRTPDGRYLPPYGHRHEVNPNWFEDYGADLKLGSTEYAYTDGRFQIELPLGDIYVEVVKGFEYLPLRQHLTIQPGQRELRLRIDQPFDWHSKGWVTADTHVHFLSPQTAWLEAQAEGINLVNLLATQWGDLFTNVGDITGALSGVSTPDTLVWVGTENRQHMLGHMSLLGTRGTPVYPMTTAGPDESYLGDPIESSLAEWADRCREKEGLVIIPHFPLPHLEVAADVVLGKVDGVEIKTITPTMDNYPMREWYRLLNLGYRLAAVGGTDKMAATMPIGGIRTYAYLGNEEFTFASWAHAVRAGRTFTTSGPLIGLLVEGHMPGDEIKLPESGGTLEVDAWVDSTQPIHELQLVVNGSIVDRVTQQLGARQVRLHSKVHLGSSAWIAARCVSRLVNWHEWPINWGAHTSPVYVIAGEEELFNPSDALYMLTLLEGGLTYLDTLAIPSSATTHEKIKDVFRDAQAELHRRLHVHRQAHTHGHSNSVRIFSQ
jgi:hypothetical protein